MSLSDQIIALQPVAQADRPDNVRCMPQMILDGGFQPWIEKYITPLIDKGVRRFLIHNIGGHPFHAGVDYQFDQWLRLARLLGGNHAAIRNQFSGLFYSEDVEMIAHVGCPPDAWASYSRWRAWMDACLAVFVRNDMNISFDAIVLKPDIGPIADYCDELQAKGTKIYVNSLTWKSDSRWRDFDCLADVNDMQQAQKQGVDLKSYGPGKIIPIFQDYNASLSQAKKVVASGGQCAAMLNKWLLDGGQKLEAMFS